MNQHQNSNHDRLILASKSPRRRELFSSLELPFEILSPDIEETPWPNEPPDSFALRMAHEKALAVLSTINQPDAICIISADTDVVLEGKILGKPCDDNDATRMLRSLSGKSHDVITGLCVMRYRDGHTIIHGESVKTRVTFRVVTDSEIHHYVATGEPMDKAGAYAIQGGAGGMIDHIDGSYSNVVGLPMETLTRLLRK